jgi:hypothetical protein
MLLSKQTPHHSEISLTSFGFFTKEEITKLSVLKIDNDATFDVTGMCNSFLFNPKAILHLEDSTIVA